MMCQAFRLGILLVAGFEQLVGAFLPDEPYSRLGDGASSENRHYRFCQNARSFSTHLFSQPPFDRDDWVRWSSESLHKFTGETLVDKLKVDNLSGIHDNSLFAVLSHGTQDDPIYHYFNQGALELFERTPEEILTLPSRLSAPEGQRPERARIVQAVVGEECRLLPELLRVTKSGKLFRAKNVALWNVYDDEGTRRGQTACVNRADVTPVEDDSLEL